MREIKSRPTVNVQGTRFSNEISADTAGLTQRVLEYLCVGRYCWGIHFLATPILLITERDDLRKPLDDEIYLTIETRWHFYDLRPEVWPEQEHDVPEPSIEDLAYTIATLRYTKITEARLGAKSPHLILSFENGKTLFVNGHDERYESWTLSAGDFTVVAKPGDEVSVWTPNGF